MTRPLEPVRRAVIRAHAIQALLDLPESIGRYQIRGELGRGGMGVVYHAYDPQLERDVAIKVINPSLLESTPLEPRLDERFEREMRAASPIFHANVVTILDAGSALIADERSAYYVMERVIGESLEDQIRRSGPLPRKEALGVALAVAKGLHALHQRGLVHRDVKPSNVLLPMGRPPKISDFGLIHLIGDSSLSRDGSTIEGSPHGLAPEQIGAGLVDERSDLFALGALIIRMWTGEEPFSASSLQGRLARIQSDEPDGVEKLPSDVRKLVRSLLAKAPDDRPGSTQEVIVQLTHLHARTWPPRIRTITRWLAVAGGTAVLGIGWTLYAHARLAEQIAQERSRQAAAIESQLERAGTLARPLLSASALASLPADERRALGDRIEGIANRVTLLRSRHQDNLARLQQRRFPWSGWLSPIPSAPPSAQTSPPLAAVQDPDRHFDEAERQRIRDQIDLLQKEFGVETQVVIAPRGKTDPPPPVAGDPTQTAEPTRVRRLRIVLDCDSPSGSIEVSEALEPILTDSFLGALLREQILPHAARDQTEFGLRLAMRIIRASLREAAPAKLAPPSDQDTSPLSLAHASNEARFSGGGVSTVRVPASEGLSGTLRPEQRQTLSAGETPEQTWNRFVRWIKLETSDVDVTLFTEASRELLRNWPASRPYWRSLQRNAKETPLQTLSAGARALVYAPNDPELAPTFFRRGRAGWQIDLVAGRTHIVAIAAGPRRWSFHNVDADPLVQFRKDLIVSDGLIRLASRSPGETPHQDETLRPGLREALY